MTAAERLGFDPATLSERRIALLIATWVTIDAALADELRALLRRLSRGSFAAGF